MWVSEHRRLLTLVIDSLPNILRCEMQGLHLPSSNLLINEYYSYCRIPFVHDHCRLHCHRCNLVGTCQILRYQLSGHAERLNLQRALGWRWVLAPKTHTAHFEFSSKTIQAQFILCQSYTLHVLNYWHSAKLVYLPSSMLCIWRSPISQYVFYTNTKYWSLTQWQIAVPAIQVTSVIADYTLPYVQCTVPSRVQTDLRMREYYAENNCAD